MSNSGLLQAEREREVALILAGKPLRPRFHSALFADDDAEYVEATKRRTHGIYNGGIQW